MKRKFRFSRFSMAIVLVAVAVGAGMFVLSRQLNQRDSHRLLTLQAGDAQSSVTSLMAQLESTISSVGAVAAATNANPAALQQLTKVVSGLDIFETIAVLHQTPSGLSVTVVRGQPSAPVTDLGPSKSEALAMVVAKGGYRLLGFFGSGAQRRLAVAIGPPSVPAGYVVYSEVPLPTGLTDTNAYPGLEYALYAGPTTSSEVLFSSTKDLPLKGELVKTLVDPNTFGSDEPSKPGDEALLFVATSRGSVLGVLSDLLPWILAIVAVVLGLLVAFVFESTARRRDVALAMVSDLEKKNIALDHAMAEQVEAEQIRVRLEDELRQSQRLEAIGQLAGGVAHDFNNLLMVILSHGEFMEEELPEGHPVHEDLGEVRKAARRAAELTRQLLVFSRRDLVEPSVLDVNEAISGVVNLLRRTVGEDVRLESVLLPHLPSVLCDPGELQQVLMNLVVNARQAIDGDGTITIETSQQILDENAASAHPSLEPGSYVRISVTDTGCGMTPETASRVFEPYFTTKDPSSGTGLGLSTVYGIVRRYRGYVTVYSELNVGTTFKIYLPATDAEAGTSAAPEELQPEALADMRGTIMVVEDEDAVRNACRRILERAGFGVIEANNGTEALARLDGLRIDLLLTDVVMPGGMSGRDLVREIEQVRPGLPVLYMSGYNADAIATRGVLDPGISIVEKPFSSAELLSKVREFLS